jgi:hypothetical protein
MFQQKVVIGQLKDLLTTTKIGSIPFRQNKQQQSKTRSK